MEDRTLIVGVMGGGAASDAVCNLAFELGSHIAGNGWILLNGGRNAGVMAASAKGAYDAGGITIGVLPDETPNRVSPHIRIPILTGMGNARNVVNVLSSQVVVACPGGAGTLSEIALAIKCARPVILLAFPVEELFHRLNPKAGLWSVETPEAAVERIRELSISGCL